MSMMITRFNKMVRNRFLWGAFAILVCVSFVGYIGPSYSCRGKNKPAQSGPSEGTLAGKNVTPHEFTTARFFELGLRENAAPRNADSEENLRRRAWKRIAVLRMAEQMGVTAADDEIGETIRRDPAFQANGVFSKQRYEAVVSSQLRVPVQMFEQYVREMLTIRKMLHTLESLVWAAPSEVQRRVANLTDVLSVQYVTIGKDPARDKATINRADAEKYYDAHQSFFTVPAKVSVAYVSFPLGAHVNTNDIADAAVSAYYDDHVEDFSVLDTNGLTVALPLAEAREHIAAVLARESAAEKVRDAGTDFAMALAPDRQGNAPSFAEAAARSNLTISTSALFAADERVPGIEAGLDFNAAAFALDTNDPERAASDAILGSNAVYVMTLAQRRDSHLPPFADVTGRVMPIAATNAQQEAFTRRVASLRDSLKKDMDAAKSFMDAAKGMGLNVSTTAPLSIYESMTTNAFEHAEALVPKLLSLQKGDLTEPVVTPDGAIIAAVTDRQSGDFTTAQMLTPELVRSVTAYNSGLLFEDLSDHLIADGRLKDRRLERPEDLPEGTQPGSESPARDDAQRHAGELL